MFRLVKCMKAMKEEEFCMFIKIKFLGHEYRLYKMVDKCNRNRTEVFNWLLP